MMSGTTIVLLTVVFVNVFMVLVAATDSTVNKDKSNDEQLEDLLAVDGLLQFQKHQARRGPPLHNVTKESSSHPAQMRAVIPNLVFEKPELDIFVEEEEFLLPTDTELRHHIRKRQVITEADGSGSVDDGVETRVTLNQEFSSVNTTSLASIAESLVTSFYTAAEVGQFNVTATVTDAGNSATLITFITRFESVNNRILVAYVFKKDIKGITIGGYSQQSEPTVLNAASVLKTVTCFLCPADRPCGSGTECAAFSTAVSADLFPWGFSTCDSKLLNNKDSVSSATELEFGIIFNNQSQGFVYVGDNGIMSFSTTSGTGFNPHDLTDINSQTEAFICAFCYDVDLRNTGRSGDVFHQCYTVGEEGALPFLLRATNEVQVLNSDFEAQEICVVTWFDVPYFQSDSSTTPSTQRNLFQAVLITNGAASYVLLFHKDMEWPQSFQDNSVVGFRHLSTTTLQNYKKVKESGDNRVQSSFDTFTGNTGTTGKFLLSVGSLSTVSSTITAKQACGTWYKANFPLKSQFITSVNAMARCPCSQTVINNLSTFTATSDENGLNCYNLIRPSTTNDGLRCCYRNGAYATDTPNSRYLRFRNGVSGYNQNDVLSLQNCCTNSDLCSLFTELRPQLACTAASQTSSSTCFGDPHVNTLDGVTYTFNGYGEFTMFELDATAAQPFQFKFKLQARTVPAKQSDGTDSQATIFQAFAGVQEGSGNSNGGEFHVEMNMERTRLVIFVNDIDRGASFYDNAAYTLDEGNINIKRNGDHVVQFTFPESDITIIVRLIAETLAIETEVKERYYTLTKGLMGIFDGNIQNDLATANGDVIPLTSTDRAIFEMGKTWRVTSATSILRYDNGKTWANSNVLDFQPVFFDEISDAVKNASLTVCTVITNEQCILDFVATGNQALASATKDTQTAADVTKSILSNRAPSLTASTSVINVEVSQTTTLNFQSTDPDGDSRTFVASLQPSTGFSLNAQDGSTTWTPADASPVGIVVNARDSNGGVSVPINIAIVLCEGCQNGGTCDYTTTRAPTTANAPENFKLAACTCTTGWTGTDCSQDIDGCATSPCGVQRNCTDVPAATQATSGDVYTCGPCLSGYAVQPGGVTCVDVNECTANTHGCPTNSQCENTEGGFLCNCNTGYRKRGAVCVDINECEERSSGCGHTCTNTDGSFTCSCRNGFTLAADQKACTAPSTPPSACTTFGCSDVNHCTVESGSPVCFCDPGYTLNADNKACDEVDECTLNICAQECANNAGSFQCSCFDGFQLNTDGHSCTECAPPKWGPNCQNTCSCNGHESSCDSMKGCVCEAGWTGTNCETDINECQVNPSICGFTQQCENMDGTYKCTCPSGYAKSGTDCIDINECDASNPCPSNSQCVNSVGSYTCNCDPGFIKSGSNCVDINECTTGQTGCEQSCQNKAGSYNCLCNTGYILNDDRRTCIRFGDDPCNGQGGCLHYCELVNGAATCRCRIGYQLASDNRACDDIDECADNTLNTCTDKSTCRNTAGGFECSCPAGQKLANDARTCVACDSNHWGLNCANECSCSSLGSTSCNSQTGCVCRSGWTGDKCDVNVDQCATVTCQANSDCENLPGTFRCKCRAGYKLSAAGNTCEDVNECAVSSDNECDHMCTNNMGSYTCTCQSGFVLSGKGTCNDINECDLGTSGCPQFCRNTLGGYSCSCFEGYTLDPTNSTICIQSSSAVCVTALNSQCSQNCRRLSGGTEECFCDPGYTLNANGINCDDIKECDLDPPRCSQSCTEADGSYTCSCNDGFKLADDGTTCSPCEENKFGTNCASTCSCTANSISCNATDGSCECRSGWTGSTCATDIKECTVTPDICGTNGQCNERDGSFTCTCVAGYIRNNDQCIPCDSTHFGENCAQTCACNITNTISCRATDGFCTCKPQWQGATCIQDVDECDNASACTGNNETCNNLDGSFECNCDAGFVKAPNNTCIPCNFGYYGAGCATQCNCVTDHFESCDNLVGTCTCKSGYNGTDCAVNIDECQQTPPSCNTTIGTCRDTDGSYVCDCKTGYNNTADGSCADIDECADNTTNNCIYICNNTIGSFFCSCPIGFSGTGNNCVAVYRSYLTEVTLNIDRTAIITGSNTSEEYTNLASSIAASVNQVVSRISGNAHVPAVVTSMSAGSVIAIVELRVDPTKTSSDPDAVAAAMIKALQNTASLTVDGTIAPVTQVRYNGTTILTSMNVCDVLKLIKALAADEFCEVGADGIPVISKLPSTDVNIPLIVGLTVPIALILGVLLALIIFICCCKKSKSSQRTPSDEGRDVPFRSAFVGNLPTKGNFGASRYMMYSPHTLSETASQASGDSGFRYTRPKILDGRSDFLDMPGPIDRGFHPITPRDAVDRNPRSNFSWENMFNMLEPSRHAPFEVPRPNVTNSPNRVYRNGRSRDSLA